MKRKGLLASLASMALLLGVTSVALAQFPNGTVVAETLHNLRQSVGGPMDHEDLGEICVYCHTPHQASTTAPLWNRADPAGPFTMYSSTSLDMPIAGSPQGASLACLSCHDGTIGVDEVLNYPSGFDPTTVTPGLATIAGCEGCHAGGAGGFNFDNTNLGQDLSNDHPISITYSPALDPNFNAAGAVTGAGVPLPDGDVECSSCHNPHSAEWPSFLRLSNDNSALCLTCHNI